MPGNKPTSVRARSASAMGALLYMMSGLLIWALHLTLVYGIHTLACARGYTADKIFDLALPSIAVIGITSVALAALIGVSFWPEKIRRPVQADAREERPFQKLVMHWLALLSAFGILWAGITVAFVSPCVALR